jgi:putative membrane protein
MMMFALIFILVIGFGLVLLLGIGVAIVYALGKRPGFNLPGLASSRQTPLELLQARYARGEISKAEYEELRRDLEG